MNASLHQWHGTFEIGMATHRGVTFLGRFFSLVELWMAFSIQIEFFWEQGLKPTVMREPPARRLVLKICRANASPFYVYTRYMHRFAPHNAYAMQKCLGAHEKRRSRATFYLACLLTPPA